ncbi:MAG: signal peptide peptidase SppA [Chlorobiaceae bacterium]|nr:signal peptide peptidase SppA [Chlorobiaceae bacterium]
MNNTNTPKKKRGCFRNGCLAFIIIFILFCGGMFWALRSSHSLPDRFVLCIPLGGTISETRHESSSLPFFSSRESLSLQEILFILDHAATDERIKEVLLDIGGLQATPAKIAEIRQAVEHARRGGKKVTALLHSAEDNDYLLAAACDSIIIERGGFLLLDGLKAETLFYTTPFGKLGVSFQAAQWKKYKSGIEPFLLTGSSKESLEEINVLLDEVFDDYLGYLSKRRGITRDALTSLMNSEPLMSAGRAKELKLVDGIASSWELQRSLTKKITGKDLTSDNDAYVRAAQYRSAVEWPLKAESDESIAVVTLSGMIVRSAGSGAGEVSEGIDVETLRNSLDSALENNKVKAIVLRIDSPGGDALASSDMLQMLDAAAKRKPLVVSMSGVAASGGYMAALAGKTIYAEPLTITGSIGVYALKPNIKGLAEKIGLGRTVVTRGRYADANTLFKPLEGDAYNKFVAAAGEVYYDFIGKVAASRKMRIAQVDSVAGGRVWTGSRAMKAGLVDRMGGLFDAIHAAQLLAKIDPAKHPKLVLYPVQKAWWEFLRQGSDTGLAERISAAIKKQLLHEFIPEHQFSTMEAYYEMLMVSGQLHMLAVMPCEITIR